MGDHGNMKLQVEFNNLTTFQFTILSTNLTINLGTYLLPTHLHIFGPSEINQVGANLQSGTLY